MYLPAPGSDFELAPAGTHLAVCYRILDLGTQKTTFQGKEKDQHKIMLSWELAEEKMKDGRPFTISKRYTWSMDKKANLRKDLEAWRGVAFKDSDFGATGFNLRKVLGVGCLLTVSHSITDDKEYANISTVSKLMKGMTAPKPTNEIVYLWLSADLWEPSTFHKLGEGLQKIIMKAPEYLKLNGGVDDDELPPDDGIPPVEHVPDGNEADIPF